MQEGELFRKVKCEFVKAKRHFVKDQNKNQLLNLIAFVLEYLQLVPEMESLVAPARFFSFFPFLVSVVVFQCLISLCLKQIFAASSFRVSIP